MSEKETELKNGEFVYGVLDTFELTNSEDLVTIGKIKGTIRVGDKVYISNPGDDDDEVIVTKVSALENNNMPIPEATDMFVSLRICDGKAENIKPGSVIRSEDVDKQIIQNVYVNSLGESYIGKRKFVFSDDDTMRMSISDCAEAMRLFVWLFTKDNEPKSKEEIEECRKKCDAARKIMAKKILKADEIYLIINKGTGEPHLFSTMTKRGEGYYSSPAEIKIFTKAYLDVAKNNFPEDKFEIRKIENKDIESTLYDAFYLNGAYGVRVMFDSVAIGADTLVQKEDYSNCKLMDIPVTNPSFMRWMLLRAQIGVPNTDEEKLVAKIYYRMFAIEMAKAKFIMPVKFEGEVPEYGDDGKFKNMLDERKVKFPTVLGKDGKRLTFLYTDFKRFKRPSGEEWKALSTPIEQIVNFYDIAINTMPGETKGCFINKEMYAEIKKISDDDNAKK